jgi:hypothetical protein
MTENSCAVDGVPISYTDTGTGPVLLFVHGVYVTGALWNDVVTELDDRFRCIVPTWPLGAQEPVGGDADLGAEAAARRIVHLIEALDHYVIYRCSTTKLMPESRQNDRWDESIRLTMPRWRRRCVLASGCRRRLGGEGESAAGLRRGGFTARRGR